MTSSVSMNRAIRWGPETVFGTAPASLPYVWPIAGESLKRIPTLRPVRSEQTGAVNRQIEIRRSTGGSVDPYLNYVTIGQVLGLLVNAPTVEDLGSGVLRYTFIPNPKFEPDSIALDVARDVKIHRYTGQVLSAGRLSFGLGDKHLGMSLQAIGQDEADGGAVPRVSPLVFPHAAGIGQSPAASPIVLSLSDGSTTWAAWAESVDLNFSWDRRLRANEQGLLSAGVVGGGIVSASGKLKWFYDEDTDWLLADYRSRADVGLTVTLQGALIGGGIYETLEVSMPLARINGEPPTLRGSGFGNIDFSIDLMPLLDAATGYPFRFRLTNGPWEQELLQNPGDEAGLTGGNPTGWTAVSVAWGQDTRVGVISTFLYPGPHSGTYYFSTTNNSASPQLYQDVDVSAFATLIDAGLQAFRFTGWYCTLDEGVSSDEAEVIVTYKDQSGAVLSTYDTGAIQHFDTWSQLSDTRMAPAGTRTIRVLMAGIRHTGSEADAFFDDFSLKALRPY